MMEISPVPAFQDNYFWLVQAPGADKVAVVDPGAAEPVRAALKQQGKRLGAILVTHHHADHVGGVKALAREFGVKVWGPSRELPELVDFPLREGDPVRIPELELEFEVLDLPGHTLDHIGYVTDKTLFCGDTLFNAGCGRLFEGTAKQMAASLDKLAALPGDTWFYCAHEYTLANLAFAEAVEPENHALPPFRHAAEAKRAAGKPTVPSTIAEQFAVNPFMRCREASVKSAAEKWSGEPLSDNVRVFAAVRRWKDGFQG